MKIAFAVCFMVASLLSEAQLSGSIESSAALYIDDNKIKLEQIEAKNRFRSNSYLRLDYKLNNFTAGVQLESYQPKALLNYSPKFKGTNLGTYYVSFKNDSIGLDVLAGHFYEQFGCGLVLRSWEDRQLGIANSIAGGRIKYSPLSSVNFTALYGKQRNGLGFDFSDGTIAGLNSDIELSSLLNVKKVAFGLGVSFVNRKNNDTLVGNAANNYLTSTRVNFKWKSFTADFEYAFKSKDALVEFGNVRPELQFDGDAYLLNLGFTKKGFGVNANFRRLENFGFFSQRNLSGNIYNEGVVNYLPALTKQYDYSLTNIYVYAAQSNISFEPNRNKAGEIGGQVDVFYNFKKETPLGGKYGTNISVNFSRWYGLGGKYIAAERKYEADKFRTGEQYYRDASLEVRKKWNVRWSSILTFQNQFYNARFVEEASGQVNANTLVFDNTLRLKKSRSIKLQLQHQWADGLFDNWAATQAEYNFSTKFSVFAIDLYNYGNPILADRLHFYNAGVVYKNNAGRIQASYGRQRGGLICVGGVCRFVPESAGLNMSFSYSFYASFVFNNFHGRMSILQQGYR